MIEGVPTIRVQDRCAWCGHALAVLTRAWENVRSDTARVICANYCDGNNGCAQAGCPQNCHARAEVEPRRVVIEIQRRQQIARRANERREEKHRARNK